MSLDLASRYLSVDQGTFRRLAAEHRVETVEAGDGEPRWRKLDLDRLCKRLPTRPTDIQLRQQAQGLPVSEADIARLAEAIAMRSATTVPRPSPELVSIKEASRLLGLGRSTIYVLINEGRLQTRRIGRRTLIPRTAIEALLGEHSD